MSATHTKEATAATSETIDELSKKATAATSETIDKLSKRRPRQPRECRKPLTRSVKRP